MQLILPDPTRATFHTARKAMDLFLCSTVLAAAALAPAAMQAQAAGTTPATPPPGRTPAHVRRADVPRRGWGPAGMRPGAQIGAGRGAEVRGGLETGYIKPMANAPYSATITQSHIQRLDDGVTLSHSRTISVARDSEGRVRVEMTLTPRAHAARPGSARRGSANSGAANSGAAQSAAAAGPRKIVVVYDPVAGTVTRWSDQSKTAIVTPLRRTGMGGRAGGWGRPGMRGAAMRGAAMRGHEMRGHEMREPGRMGRGGMGPRGAGMMNHVEFSDSSLGTKTMDGVSATGERTTHTIAAGAMNNDKPIVSSTERWRAPELGIVLSDTKSDPFRGTDSVEVANLSRSEPAAELFKAPTGYTVQNAGMMGRPGMGRGGFGQRGPGQRGPGAMGRQGRSRPAPPANNAAPAPAAPQN